MFTALGEHDWEVTDHLAGVVAAAALSDPAKGLRELGREAEPITEIRQRKRTGVCRKVPRRQP